LNFIGPNLGEIFIGCILAVWTVLAVRRQEVHVDPGMTVRFSDHRWDGLGSMSAVIFNAPIPGESLIIGDPETPRLNQIAILILFLFVFFELAFLIFLLIILILFLIVPILLFGSRDIERW